MQILRPLKNIVSSKVNSWKEVKDEALELKEFLIKKTFEGHWDDAFAISHAQVSESPKNFFVLHEKLYKKFGSWCVVNLEILEKEEPCTFPEGCMSFPFRKEKRIDRYAKIKVKYWVPFLDLFLVPKWKTFKDLEAFICQHEDDHSKGVNIYDL